MIFRKGIISLLLFLLVAQFAEAQRLKEFSGISSEYPNEIFELFKGNLRDDEEAFLESFFQAWEIDSAFSEEEKQDIISISNQMLEARARSRPHFLDYLTTLVAFKDNNHPFDSYKQWELALLKILSADRVSLSSLSKLFESTCYLLNDNIIAKSASTAWKIDTRDFKFRFQEQLFADVEETNLTCLSKRDSIIIFETMGMVNMNENDWHGKGGLVTWERSGFTRDKVNARLQDYNIALRKSEFAADSVLYTDKRYFNDVLMGRLENKVMVIRSTSSASYPRFDSYKKDFEIEDLYENIDYKGGMSVQGSKLIGRGSNENDAVLYFYRNDTLKLVAGSHYFTFQKEKVLSSSASIKIYLENDSIYHGDLAMQFKIKERELSLTKSDNYTSLGSYSNSYHMLDMNFEQLIWNIDEPEALLTMARGASTGRASFESVNFFDYSRFNKIRGMDVEHPLFVLKKFAEYNYSKEFPVHALADYLKQSIHQVKQMLMRMAFMGFVFYDEDTEWVKLRPRLYDFINSSVGKIDYDVIYLESITDAPLENATLNMRNFDLSVNGVPEIRLSSAQNVVIYPKNNQITFKRNRNFEFDGIIQAGLFTFYGESFFFHYDSFKIALRNVDSLYTRVETGQLDNFGLPVTRNIKNLVQHITGDILLDDPRNKSGNKDFPEYPILNSYENSFVFYDDIEIQEGKYPKTEFYFEIYPFSIDSIDNMKKESLGFEGKFISAGIFPEMEQKLVVQSDYSLGFNQETTSEGMPVYGGKGTYYSTIQLSNKGLIGAGRVDYLTSTSYSDEFKFFPDSVNADLTRFVVNRQTTGVQYPRVENKDLYMHWLPLDDEMYSYQRTTPFTILTDTTTLAGDLKLEPTGLTGQGIMDLKSANLTSSLFTYEAYEILADTADFDLKSLHKEGYTVLTDNIKAHVNYQEKKGTFNSNDELTFVEFPENKYVSYLDYFIWEMMENKLNMGSDNPMTEKFTFDDPGSTDDLIGARYLSMDPKQDSVNFVSPYASYDYEKNEINATGVKYLDIADARIIPSEGNVVVKDNGYLKKMEGAVIETNRNTKYHQIYDALVNVYSRLNYDGSGYYDYVDENEEVQQIFFSEISIDTALQTIARGTILEPDDFTLSPYFKYQGRVRLSARKEFLKFEGAVQIVQECETLQTSWLSFNAEIDPLNIFIPVPTQPKDINLQNTFVGLYMTTDSIHIYPAFISGRKNYNDIQLTSAEGFLYYLKDSGYYEIASKEKLYNRKAAGNYFRLERDGCSVFGEGEIDLGMDLGQIKVASQGTVRGNLAENKYTFNMMMGIDFLLNEESLNLMGHEIDSVEGLETVDITREQYLMNMETMVGEKVATKVKEDISLYGDLMEIPPEIKKTMILTDVTLTWNDNTNSYQSDGKLGVGFMNGIQVNKQTEGYIEIIRKRSGDLMDIYLKPEDRTWYYFGYSRGVMQTLSSNLTYVNYIKELSANRRKMNVESGETSYIYMLASDQKFSRFLRRYRDRYLENQEEYPDEDIPDTR
jgi:hypothetical protein